MTIVTQPSDSALRWWPLPLRYPLFWALEAWRSLHSSQSRCRGGGRRKGGHTGGRRGGARRGLYIARTLDREVRLGPGPGVVVPEVNLLGLAEGRRRMWRLPTRKYRDVALKKQPKTQKKTRKYRYVPRHTKQTTDQTNKQTTNNRETDEAKIAP